MIYNISQLTLFLNSSSNVLTIIVLYGITEKKFEIELLLMINKTTYGTGSTQPFGDPDILFPHEFMQFCEMSACSPFICI